MAYDLTRLCELKGAVQMAENELASAIKQELPQGTRVSWMHGHNVRRATVMGHSYPRTRVESSSGRLYWIDTWRIYHDGDAGGD